MSLSVSTSASSRMSQSMFMICFFPFLLSPRAETPYFTIYFNRNPAPAQLFFRFSLSGGQSAEKCSQILLSFFFLCHLCHKM